MKNTVSKITGGILFILFGLALAGKTFGIFDFNLFFEGWWTLFIIIPCSLGLSDRNNRIPSIIGLGVGILLLFSAQGIFEWYMFMKLLIAFIFVVIGFCLIFRRDQGKEYLDNSSDNSESTRTDDSRSESTNHNGYNHFSAILSGRNVQFVDEIFTGANISSILGNVQLDLRNAILNKNAVIETTCILGGVDIFVPSNVKVVVNCTPILAGVDSDVITPFNTSGEIYTLFINGTCILGGIDVK